MKKLFITSLLAAALLTTSCEMESDSSGKLGGMWHLQQVDTLTTGGVKDLSEQLVFWQFQGKLLDLVDKNNLTRECLVRFEHAGGTLKLSDPYRYNREEGDEKLETPDLLRPYGVNALEESFAVEALSGSKMVLRSETLRLRLKKF